LQRELEVIRAAILEAAKSFDLAATAPSLRVINGEMYVTGQTVDRMTTGADFRHIIDRLQMQVGPRRIGRLETWVLGKPLDKFGLIERGQLLLDLDTIREHACRGGYRHLFREP